MRASDIAARLAGRAEEFAQWLFPQGKRHGRDWCVGSLGGEAGHSLKICVTGARAGVWCDFAGCQEDRGDLLGLLIRAQNLSLGEACRAAMDWLEIPMGERGSGSHQVLPPPRIETRAPSETWLRIQKTMRPGTLEELHALAARRQFPALAGLELATRAGHLWFADIRDGDYDYPSWILTDGSRHNAQARKLDGSLFEHLQGKPAKAKTITGCEAAWPVGIAEAADKTTLFMVEGGPDLLAAWHLIWLLGRTRTHAPVAMFGISNPIHAAALPLFKGKLVRIFPHNDPDLKGMNGAIRWRSQILQAGALAVDFFDFTPEGNKDLNEMITQYGIPELKVVS